MNMIKAVPLCVVVASSIALGLGSGITSAQPVYKSINAQGQTVYSSEPPPRATQIKQVELAPGPTPEEVKAAERAGARVEKSAQNMRAERMARERESADKRAETASAAAEQKQEQEAAAQVQKNDTLREYYGYRDYTFPTPAVGAGKGVTVRPGGR